jgi:hypothetical protein
LAFLVLNVCNCFGHICGFAGGGGRISRSYNITRIISFGMVIVNSVMLQRPHLYLPGFYGQTLYSEDACYSDQYARKWDLMYENAYVHAFPQLSSLDQEERLICID